MLISWTFAESVTIFHSLGIQTVARSYRYDSLVAGDFHCIIFQMNTISCNKMRFDLSDHPIIWVVSIVVPLIALAVTLPIIWDFFPCSGRSQTRFVPIDCITAAVINEAVTPAGCYFYLAILMQGHDRLVLAFEVNLHHTFVCFWTRYLPHLFATDFYESWL